MWRYGSDVPLGYQDLVLAPSHRLGFAGDFHHRYTLVHGTDEAAEIASDAVRLTHDRNGLAWHAAWAISDACGLRIEQINALMRAIFARDMAEVASDAGVVVDAGHAFEVEIQILPFVKRGDGSTDKSIGGVHVFAVEVGVKTIDHALHDPESMVHNGSADLDRSRAEGHELCRIAPIRDASNARYG